MKIVDHQFYLGDFDEAYSIIRNEADIPEKDDCDWTDLYENAELNDMDILTLQFEDGNVLTIENIRSKKYIYLWNNIQSELEEQHVKQAIFFTKKYLKTIGIDLDL